MDDLKKMESYSFVPWAYTYSSQSLQTDGQLSEILFGLNLCSITATIVFTRRHTFTSSKHLATENET